MPPTYTKISRTKPTKPPQRRLLYASQQQALDYLRGLINQFLLSRLINIRKKETWRRKPYNNSALTHPNLVVSPAAWQAISSAGASPLDFQFWYIASAWSEICFAIAAMSSSGSLLRAVVAIFCFSRAAAAVVVVVVQGLAACLERWGDVCEAIRQFHSSNESGKRVRVR